MMKKSLESICLVSCRSPFLDDAKIYAPMANLYLKSFLNREAPQIRSYLLDDDYSPDNPEVFEPYDAIGISIMTPQRTEANQLARTIKQFYPDKIVIAGGPHVKHYTDQVINNPDFDFVVPLDGERPLVQIMTGTAPNRVIMDNMSKKDILDAPRPDRTSPDAIALLRRYHYKLNGREATTLMTARGCPEQCEFCEDRMTAVRWSSYHNIEGELDDIKSLGYQGVYIFDDLFAIAMPKIKPICEMLKKRDLVFRCNGQARYFTKWGEDMAKLLADSGCVEIAFGHESGSQKILDNISKRTTVEQNYRSVEYAKKHGIKVKSFILLGLPGEDMDTLRETERFIATAGMDDFQAAVFMPFKGTEIRRKIDAGEFVDLRINGKGVDGDVTGAYGIRGGETSYEVRTEKLSSEDLERFRNYLVKVYKPRSHSKKWEQEDMFFQQSKVEGNFS